MTAEQGWIDELDSVQETDFLEFWSAQTAQARRRTVRILGADVPVPTDLPLRVQAMAQQIDGTESEDDLRGIIVDVFGEDYLDTWVAAGLTTNMFKAIMAWGIANGAGTSTTFAEALALSDKLEKAEAEAGKAPQGNRSARRASSRTAKSGSTGSSSSRTSGGSTGSRRRTSGT